MNAFSQREKGIFSVRKPDLDFTRALNRYYIKKNAVASHYASAYNFCFPDAELFFIDSVKRYQGSIKNSTLSQEIKIFIGQESQHRSKHGLFIDELEQTGYDLTNVRIWTKRLFGTVLRCLPFAMQLALTAGFEHVTAATSHFALQYNMFNESGLATRRLWIWHCIEELEHKHVAYNVLLTIHPNNYLLRTAGFLIALVSIHFITILGMVILFRQDFRQNRMTFGRLIKHSKLVIMDSDMRNYLKGVYTHLILYFKPGFHPDQVNEAALIGVYLPEVIQYSK